MGGDQVETQGLAPRALESLFSIYDQLKLKGIAVETYIEIIEQYIDSIKDILAEYGKEKQPGIKS